MVWRSTHAGWLDVDWQTDAAQTLTALQVEPVGWLVVDHYALDSRWERELRPTCRRLMVIDDLADRSHDCDLLLDQNLGREAADYAGLVPPDSMILVGPKYALLRPEFAADMPERCSDLEMHIIEKAGHWVNREQTEAFNGYLIPWLKRRFA